MSTEASPKMKKFLQLARVLRSVRDRHYADLEDEQDAFGEAEEWLGTVGLNLEDDATLETKLENTAGLLGAALALGDVLMRRISEEQIEAIIASNWDSEVDE